MKKCDYPQPEDGDEEALGIYLDHAETCMYCNAIELAIEKSVLRKLRYQLGLPIEMVAPS